MKKLLFFSILVQIFTGCSKGPDPDPRPPVVNTVPLEPFNLTATAVSHVQVNLSWTDISNNETGVRIERKTGTGPFVVIATVGANVTS